jgi:hypothetical protein
MAGKGQDEEIIGRLQQHHAQVLGWSRQHVAAEKQDLRLRLSRTQVRSRSGPKLAASIAVCGMVLVAVALVATSLVPKRAIGPGATLSYAPTGASSPVPTAASGSPAGIVVTAGWTDLDWSNLVAFGDATVVNDVVSWKGALWAAGLDTAGRAGLWSSADGATWTRVLIDGAVSFDGANTIDLLYGTTTESPCSGPSAAMTCGPDHFGVWTSPDGTTWTRSDTHVFGSAYVAGLTSGPNGLIAVGNLGWDKPQMWASSDGTVWQPVDVTDGEFSNSHFFVVRGWSGGYVMGGSVGGTEPTSSGTLSPAGAAAAWWSSDGRTWHAADVNRIVNRVGVAIQSLYVGRDGLLAIGSEWGGQAATGWWSSDGHVWQTLAQSWINTASGAIPDPPSDTVFDDGTRMVAFVPEGPGGQLEAWTSLDGKVWSALSFTYVSDSSLPYWSGYAPAHTSVYTFGKAFVLPDGLVVTGQTPDNPPKAVAWRVIAS